MKGNKNWLHAQLYIRVPSQILNSSHVFLYQQPKLIAKPSEKKQKWKFHNQTKGTEYHNIELSIEKQKKRQKLRVTVNT